MKKLLGVPAGVATGAALGALLIAGAATANTGEMLAPVHTFDQAIQQCQETYPAGSQDQSDCTNAAHESWGVPASSIVWPVEEDSPGWDCRIHGNHTCGVHIGGTAYNVTFASGAPIGVVAR